MMENAQKKEREERERTIGGGTEKERSGPAGNEQAGRSSVRLEETPVTNSSNQLSRAERPKTHVMAHRVSNPVTSRSHGAACTSLSVC